MDVRKITAAAMASLALSALTACSGSPAGSQPAVPAAGGGASGSAPAPAAAGSASPGAAGAAQAPYCAQVPSSMVGSALRLPVGKQVTSVAGPVSVCAYLGKYEVLVRFQVGENAGEFTQSRTSLVSLHQSVSDVAGLGDQAYFAIFGSGQRASNTLAARKGSIAVFVTAPTPLATERSLMTQVLAKV
ncbi:MAG TPA: hypothetical protein VII22_22610 [Streptosporangiaceae bacterium]